MPTYAPIYVGLYPILAETAREHGYSLTVHGSVSRDLDLVAIPWTPEAVDAQTLMLALCKCIRVATGDITDSAGRRLDLPEMKPHGRLAWAIPLGCGAVLDLSVMPRMTP